MARILFVDDDPVAREVVTDVLRAAGHEVQVAETATATMRKLLEHPVEVLLLDMRMPGMTGDRLAKVIKKNLEPPHPRIVLFSSLPVEELRRIGRKLGVTGYVRKGAPKERLLKVVEAAADLYRSESRPPERGVVETSPPNLVIPEPLE